MTTSTTINETKQSTSRIPSSRDLEIFRLAEIHGYTHAEIALDHKLTRRRVSQIVSRVRRWLSCHPCEYPRITTELQSKRLAQHIERMHLQDIIHRARHELAHGAKELATTTEKADGSKTTTFRQQPFNVQVLKTYLRAVEDLGKINARPEIPLPPPSDDEYPWLVNAIDEVYARWFDRIWSGKLKPDHIFNFANSITEEVIRAARNHEELTQAQQAEPVGPAVPATPARSASEGNVVSNTNDSATQADSSVTETPASDSSFILPPSSFPNASRASLPEAPEAQQSAAANEAPSPVTTETSASSQSAESTTATAPASLKNPKREAPPISLSPTLPLSVSPSPSPAELTTPHAPHTATGAGICGCG
jgi:hypothetical protein